MNQDQEFKQNALIEQEGANTAELQEQECPCCNGSGEVSGDYWSEDGMTSCLRCNGKGVL